MQAMEGTIHIFKHAHAHLVTGDAVVYGSPTHTQSACYVSRCPAMSITKQGPALPALLPPLQELLLLGSSLGHRGGIRCLFTLESRAPLHQRHIFLLAAWKFPPGSPEIQF